MMHRNQSTSSDPARAEASAPFSSPGAEQPEDTASIDPAARYILLPEAQKANLSFDRYLATHDIDLINLTPSLRAFGTRALGYSPMSNLRVSPSPARLAAIQWHDLTESERSGVSMESFAREHGTSLPKLSQFVRMDGRLPEGWTDAVKDAFRSLAPASRSQRENVQDAAVRPPGEQVPMPPRR